MDAKHNQQIFDLQGWANQIRVKLVTQVAFVPENKVRFAPTCVIELPLFGGGAYRPALHQKIEQIVTTQRAKAPFTSINA
jgi:hypothetical protein